MNNSLLKGHLQEKTVIASQKYSNITSMSRPYFRMIDIPFQLKRPPPRLLEPSEVVENLDIVSTFLKAFRSGSGALGGFYGADRHRVVEVVLNNSL